MPYQFSEVIRQRSAVLEELHQLTAFKPRRPAGHPSQQARMRRDRNAHVHRVILLTERAGELARMAQAAG